MPGGDRGVDDETTEQPVAPAWNAAGPTQQEPPAEPLAPPQPLAQPVPEAPQAWQPPPPRGWMPPPQQGWTPHQQQPGNPPQQQGWAAPQQGWAPPQQPSWAPPQQPSWAAGYPGQPPYWTPPQYRSSPLAVIAGIALLISGVLITLIGLLLLVVGIGGASLLEEIDPTLTDDGAAVAAVIMAVAVILLVVGILEIVGSIGVFTHKSWGRWAGIVLASVGVVLGLLLTIASFAPGGSVGDAVIAIIWLGAHGFVAAALAVAGDHFQPVYPPR